MIIYGERYKILSVYAKGWHGSTAPWRDPGLVCVMGVNQQASLACGVVLSLFLHLLGFTTLTYRKLEIYLVAIEYTLRKALETVKFHFAMAIFCTLI